MKKVRQVYANRGVEAEYRKRLDKLINAMSKSVMYWLMVDFNNKSAVEMAKAIQKRIKQWKKIFGDKSEPMALWFVQSIKKYTESGMRMAFRDVGITYPMRIPNNVINAVKIENDDLIKSIPEKYFDGIQTVCMLSLLYGWDKDRFKDELVKRQEITERRAKTIARDQSHKVNQIFKISMCKSIGVNKAMWRYTYVSQKPRETHIQMDGTLFDLDVGCYDPAVGRYIFPSELINCSCDFVPVIEDYKGEFDKIIQKNAYYQKIASGVK